MSEDTTRRVVYATAAPDMIAKWLAERYRFAGTLSASLLNRGFNDTYEITGGSGERFIARLSGARLGGLRDVQAETAFIAFLDRAGVPVAAPVPAEDGTLFQIVDLPQGPRPLVLFRFLEGRVPDVDSPQDARAQGMTLARLHDATETYGEREMGRQRCDLDQLLRRPVAAIEGLGRLAPTDAAEFAALAERLAERITALDAQMTKTRCHGDCHGLNARIATAGPRPGEAAFFDFDDGGPGPLAYDLAVHLWAQISFGRRRHAIWHAFQEGYRRVRPIAPADEAAILPFVAIRHIWLLGQYAHKAGSEWGMEHLPEPILRRELAFLLAFERERLGPRLL